MSLLSEFQRLAARNRTEHPPFVGAGAYAHHVPPVVDQLLLRGEFFTAYTPYQPEIAQGTLQALFEWQTFVTLLTGLEISNASMYDGASATAEAVLLATRTTSRDKVVVSAALHPEYRKVLATYLASTGDEIVTVPLRRRRPHRSGRPRRGGGRPDGRGGRRLPQLLRRDRRAARGRRHREARRRRSRVSVTSEAVSLGLLQAPGALGADVAVGTLQSFGNGLNFGGPAPGFLAIREGLVRQMPGRVAGATVDRNGRRGFVLTLSTREQHIRREKATSNICTNAGLAALAATIHLSLLGKSGLAHLARLNHARGRQLRDAMKQAGFGLRFSGPTFNEAAFEVGDADAVVERLARKGIAAGRPALPLVPRRSAG